MARMIMSKKEKIIAVLILQSYETVVLKLFRDANIAAAIMEISQNL